MNCCGQKRQQWQQKITQQEAAPVSPDPVLENPVKLHYHGTGTYLASGPKTGYIYLFTPVEGGLMVDGRDAALLLAEPQRFSLV